MKKTIFILLFITALTLVPFVSGALIQDYLDDSGNLQEIITLNSSIKNINLPTDALNIKVEGTTYILNNTNLQLNSCNNNNNNNNNNNCKISFTLKNVVKKETQAKSFSRNLKAFENIQYEIHIPIGSIIDLNDNNIVPKAKAITSDGKNIIVVWDVNHTDVQRYYVKFSNHEETEQTIQEIKGELSEWDILIVIGLGIILGFIIGYNLKRNKEISVVYEKLLSPDEKILLEEINKHCKGNDKSITQKELGKRLNWSKSKVSGIMALLVQKELVKKEKIGRNYAVKPLSKITKKDK